MNLTDIHKPKKDNDVLEHTPPPEIIKDVEQQETNQSDKAALLDIQNDIKDINETISESTDQNYLNTFISKPTTSQTIERLKKQGSEKTKTINVNNLPKPKSEQENEPESEQEIKPEKETKEDNKITLTDDELKYVAFLIVEVLDFGFLKLENPLQRELTVASKEQKERLTFAWQRVLITLNMRFSPLVTVFALTIITYGFKVAFAKKKEQKIVPEKQTQKELTDDEHKRDKPPVSVKRTKAVVTDAKVITNNKDTEMIKDAVNDAVKAEKIKKAKVIKSPVVMAKIIK